MHVNLTTQRTPGYLADNFKSRYSMTSMSHNKFIIILMHWNKQLGSETLHFEQCLSSVSHVLYINICLTVQVLHVVVTQTLTCILADSGTSLWWCLHGRLLLHCAVGTLWSSNLLNRPHYQPYTWLRSSKRYLHYCCSPWQWSMNEEYAEKSHKPAFRNCWDLFICK